MITFAERTVVYYQIDNPPGEEGVYLVQFPLGEDDFGHGVAMYDGEEWDIEWPPNARRAGYVPTWWAELPEHAEE